MKSNVADPQEDYEKLNEMLKNIEAVKQEFEAQKRQHKADEDARALRLAQTQEQVYQDFLKQDKLRGEALAQKKAENRVRLEKLANDLEAFKAREIAQEQQQKEENRQIKSNILKFDYTLRWTLSFFILGIFVGGLSGGIPFIYPLPFLLKFFYVLGCSLVFGAIGCYLGLARHQGLQKANEAYPLARLHKLQDAKEIACLQKGSQSTSWPGYFQSFSYTVLPSEAFSAGLRMAELNDEEKLSSLKSYLP